MKTDKKILAIFGDGQFPYKSSKYGKKKHKEACHSIVHFLREVNPDRVYCIPDNTVSIMTAILSMKLGVRTTLVSPFPGFFHILNKEDKKLLKFATILSNHFVLMSEKPDLPNSVDNIKKSVEFLVDVSNGLAFLRSHKTKSAFESFVEAIAEDDEDKTYFELVYDRR
jgi:hypothetical protein